MPHKELLKGQCAGNRACWPQAQSRMPPWGHPERSMTAADSSQLTVRELLLFGRSARTSCFQARNAGLGTPLGAWQSPGASMRVETGGLRAWSLAERVLETFCGFLELALEGCNLFGDRLEFFLGERTCLYNFVGFAIRFADGAADACGDLCELTLLGHVSPPIARQPSYTQDVS